MVLIAMLSLALASPMAAPTPDAPTIGGVWTLNKDLSDAPPARGERGAGDGREREEGGRRGYGGGGRGGFGGRGMGRGGMGRGAAANPDESARVRDAMRDVMEPSDRLTIVVTESMILITGADGRTTRLAPDGKKIKDENTGVERRTKWDGDKLVSEISGLGSGKMTQTFGVDPASRQLRVTVQIEGGRAKQPRTIAHVYDQSRD